jgi:hypothetical protein
MFGKAQDFPQNWSPNRIVCRHFFGATGGRAESLPRLRPGELLRRPHSRAVTPARSPSTPEAGPERPIRHPAQETDEGKVAPMRSAPELPPARLR